MAEATLYAVSTDPSGYNDAYYYTTGTWAASIAGTGAGTDGATMTYAEVGCSVWSAENINLLQYFNVFDLSDIPDGATITGATFAVQYTDLSHLSATPFSHEVYFYDWGASWTWRTGGSTGWLSTNLSTARVAYHTPATGDGTSAYIPFTEDGTNFVSAVNAALADDDLLRLVHTSDVARSDTAPGGGANYSRHSSADGTYPPRLVVGYTEPVEFTGIRVTRHIGA